MLNSIRKTGVLIVVAMAAGAWAGGGIRATRNVELTYTATIEQFIAVCRNLGIPADHEFGFLIRTKEHAGEIKSYHCWARFQVEGVGWIPLDASEADKHPELREYNFGSQSVDLLKFSHGRDVTLVPPQSGPPLNRFIYPYAEADGKPLATESVKFAVFFKDIAP